MVCPSLNDENDYAMDTPKEEVELEEVEARQIIIRYFIPTYFFHFEQDNEGNYDDDDLMGDASAGEDSDDGDFGLGEDMFAEEQKRPSGKR